MKTGLISGGIALIATLGISTMALAGLSDDFDTDTVYDVLDNCSTVTQSTGPGGTDCDTDDDGYGNVCDGDFDQDGSTGASDYVTWNNDFTSNGIDNGNVGTDMDCDTYVGASDYILFNTQYTAVGFPGPSGLHCAGTVPCDL